VKNNLSDAVIKQRKRDIIKASEDAGEAAADAYFTPALGYTSLTCSYPNTTGSGDVKQGVFDRVYSKTTNGITEVIVVECKGGISPLGCRNGKKQGTRAYLLDIIENMERIIRNNPSVLQNFKNTAILLREYYDSMELNNPNKILKYYVIRQPFDKDGNLKDTEIKQFQITW
jgi:hypothetical protein